MKSTIGEIIRRARKEKGLTQKQLGELSGINEVQIRSYELGRANPKLSTIEKIAEALRVPPYQILGEEYLYMKYPEMKGVCVKENAFDSYVESLGFLRNDVEEIILKSKEELKALLPAEWEKDIDNDAVTAFNINIELTKDKKKVLFKDFEYNNFMKEVEEFVNFKFEQAWKRQAEAQKQDKDTHS